MFLGGRVFPAEPAVNQNDPSTCSSGRGLSTSSQNLHATYDLRVYHSSSDLSSRRFCQGRIPFQGAGGRAFHGRPHCPLSWNTPIRQAPAERAPGGRGTSGRPQLKPGPGLEEDTANPGTWGTPRFLSSARVPSGGRAPGLPFRPTELRMYTRDANRDSTQR